MEGLRETNFLQKIRRHLSEEQILPNDVVTEIIVRLPVKAIVRFRCVSKFWCTHVKSPEFVKSHSLQKKDNDKVLLMRQCLMSPRHQDVLALYDLGSNEVKELQPIPSMARYNSTKARLLGPCDGIVCIVDGDCVTLCNPTLHEFKQLPLCTTGYRESMLGEGFGKSSTNDYKVVLIRRNINRSSAQTMVYLYNSRTNSWKEVEYDGDAYPYVFYPYNEVFFNGACHWNASNTDDTSQGMILSFDMNDEVFKELEYPDHIAETNMGLTIMNESLTMVQYERSNHWQIRTSVWVMKEYGVKSSWIKQSVIVSRNLRYPLFWRNDELWMEDRGNDQLECYGKDKTTLMNIIYGESSTFRAIIYEGSLVSLN